MWLEGEVSRRVLRGVSLLVFDRGLGGRCCAGRWLGVFLVGCELVCCWLVVLRRTWLVVCYGVDLLVLWASHIRRRWWCNVIVCLHLTISTVSSTQVSTNPTISHFPTNKFNWSCVPITWKPLIHNILHPSICVLKKCCNILTLKNDGFSTSPGHKLGIAGHSRQALEE